MTWPDSCRARPPRAAHTYVEAQQIQTQTQGGCGQDSVLCDAGSAIGQMARASPNLVRTIASRPPSRCERSTTSGLRGAALFNLGILVVTGLIAAENDPSEGGSPNGNISMGSR